VQTGAAKCACCPAAALSSLTTEFHMKILAHLILAAGLCWSSLAMADQPKMQAALQSLQQAKASLNEATADKGGHRGKAMKLIDQALKEVEAGIAYDRSHGDDKGKK
jgi:cellobiose-specific phosphotransferase system component IIA